MNGEAGELGAAATAPDAQPSPSYCVTQHPLPSPTLPAWLQPAAPCSPSRCRRPSSIVSCTARHRLSTPGDASLFSRSAGTLGRAAACGHPIRLCQGRPGAETHRAVTRVSGRQDQHRAGRGHHPRQPSPKAAAAAESPWAPCPAPWGTWRGSLALSAVLPSPRQPLIARPARSHNGRARAGTRGARNTGGGDKCHPSSKGPRARRRAHPMPQLHRLGSPRSCGYERAERWEAAQRGSARHQAHLDNERHGGDLAAWLLPAEQLDQVACDPVTQAPRDTAHLSGRGKKAPSTLSRVGKPLPGLTHRGLVFPHHPSPGESQCPTSAGSFGEVTGKTRFLHQSLPF